MNGPPVVVILLLIGLIIWRAGMWSRVDGDMRAIEEAEADRARVRAEWERRQHPSGHPRH